MHLNEIRCKSLFFFVNPSSFVKQPPAVNANPLSILITPSSLNESNN